MRRAHMGRVPARIFKGWRGAETDAMQCDEAKAALEKFGMSSRKPMAHRVRKPQSAWLAAWADVVSFFDDEVMC